MAQFVFSAFEKQEALRDAISDVQGCVDHQSTQQTMIPWINHLQFHTQCKSIKDLNTTWSKPVLDAISWISTATWIIPHAFIQDGQVLPSCTRCRSLEMFHALRIYRIARLSRKTTKNTVWCQSITKDQDQDNILTAHSLPARFHSCCQDGIFIIPYLPSWSTILLGLERDL